MSALLSEERLSDAEMQDLVAPEVLAARRGDHHTEAQASEAQANVGSAADSSATSNAATTESTPQESTPAEGSPDDSATGATNTSTQGNSDVLLGALGVSGESQSSDPAKPEEIQAQADGTLQNTDGTALTTEQIIQLDPKQKIQLSDGTVTDIQTLRANGYFKAEFDNRVRELNREKEALQHVKPILEALGSSKFAQAFLDVYRITGDEARSLRAASEATGMALPTPTSSANAPAAASNEPPKPGTDEYFLQSPAQAGFEFGTPEYDEFLLQSAEVRGRVAAERQIQAHEAKKREEEAAREAEARRQAEEARRRDEIDNTIFERNKATLNQMARIYQEEKGIDPNTLPVAQKQAWSKAVLDTLQRVGKNVADTEWMKNNFLDETHLRYVASAMPFSPTPTAPKVIPPIQAQATSQEQPLNAGGPSHGAPAITGQTGGRKSEGTMYREHMAELLKP